MIRKLAYILLPVNVLIDTLLLFSDQLSWLPLVRASALALLLFYVFYRYANHWKYYSAILVFVAYCFLQLLFVSDLGKSTNITLKICIPIASFALGFRVFNSLENIRKLCVSVLWVYGVLIANFLLSQFFQLGQSVYSDESNFRVGNLDDAWNVFTYSVLLAPLVIHFLGSNRKLKWIAYLGALSNALLVLISIKRIAILGLLTGTAIRWVFTPQIKRVFRSLFLALVGLVLLYPFVQETLSERIEARSDRFETGSLEREGRYLESQYVWEEVLSFENPMKNLFGLEGFYSVGNYAGGKFGDRQLHVDYNLIVNTVGLVGLAIYVWVFVQLACRMRKVMAVTDLSAPDQTMLSSTFWMLLLNQFVTSFAGQMYHVSYRLMVFVFLGAILGTFYSSAYARSNRLQR